MDNQSNNKVLIEMQREGRFPARSICSDSFVINPIKTGGNLLEIIFGDQFGGAGERIIYDATSLKMSVKPFSEYLANFPAPGSLLFTTVKSSLFKYLSSKPFFGHIDQSSPESEFGKIRPAGQSPPGQFPAHYF